MAKKAISERNDSIELYERIQREQKRRKWSQEKIGGKIGVHARTINRLGKGSGLLATRLQQVVAKLEELEKEKVTKPEQRNILPLLRLVLAGDLEQITMDDLHFLVKMVPPAEHLQASTIKDVLINRGKEF